MIEPHAPLVKSTTYLQDLIDSNVDRKIKLGKMTYKQILNQNHLIGISVLKSLRLLVHVHASSQ